MIDDSAQPVEGAPPHRSAGRLVFTWVATLVIEGLLYWVAWQSPALTSLVTPLYLAAILPAAIVTWRWLRPRQSPTRREGERRRLFRRSRKPDRS